MEDWQKGKVNDPEANKLIAMMQLAEMIAQYGGKVRIEVEFHNPVHVDEFEKGTIPHGDDLSPLHGCTSFGVFDIVSDSEDCDDDEYEHIVCEFEVGV